MSEDEEIVQTLDYLRHRVTVWNNRAASCETEYVRNIYRNMAQEYQTQLSGLRLLEERGS